MRSSLARDALLKSEGLRLRAADDRMLPTFNESTNPAEDRALQELVDRVYLHRDRHTGKRELRLGELPRFVDALQEAFAESTFDFFVNTTCQALTFKVSGMAEGRRGASKEKGASTGRSMEEKWVMHRQNKKRVLDQIRKSAQLCSFLAGTSSVLLVIFESADGSMREEIEWNEFLGYLAKKRNPYVTAKLNPSSEKGAAPKSETFQRTKPSMDGGTEPHFTKDEKNTFFIEYVPSANSKPVIHTDVCRLGFRGDLHSELRKFDLPLKAVSDPRYVVVAVRQDPTAGLKGEASKFVLTAYDSRSAHEYRFLFDHASLGEIFRKCRKNNGDGEGKSDKTISKMIDSIIEEDILKTNPNPVSTQKLTWGVLKRHMYLSELITPRVTIELTTYQCSSLRVPPEIIAGSSKSNQPISIRYKV